MSSPSIPTAELLAAARTKHWHQNGEALLTFENLRSWINVAGLVLFTPRSSQLPAPAPSLVEGVLGAANTEAALAEMEQAKSLLSRLVTEGIAVPLNLLGTPGETPDFVAAAPVFSYVFTLRGDKAWKQPPATSGAVKVSPLAAATHEVLTKHRALSVYDLTTQLGKEVTESAVLRALNELWAHLRVIPVGQPDGAATLWELTSARFTKHIKAGANAGQPSALSALISLYLGSAMLATEEEIETFLSPLAARSRIRDVIHALMGARELETLVVDGRTLLHVSGALPAFAVSASAADADAGGPTRPVDVIQVEAGAVLLETDAPRIKKFVAKPRKLGTGFPSDYGRKFSGAPLDPRDRPAGRAPRQDRERRPFNKINRPERPSDRKPAFDKPWDETRPAAASQDGAEGLTPRSYGRKTRADGGGVRPAFGPKPNFGRKPAFGSRRASGPKPLGGEDTPSARRESAPHPDRAGGSDARPLRKTFSKPGTFGRKRDASSADARPPRREFGDAGFTARRGGGGRNSWQDNRPGNRSVSRTAGRTFDPSAGSSSERSRSAPPRTPGSFSARPRPSFGAKPGLPRQREGASGAGERPARPTYRKFDAPRGERPQRPRDSEGGEGRVGASARPYTKPAAGEKKSFGGKPAGAGFGAKRPGSGGGKPPGTFAKFADGKNPFRKPGKPGGRGGSFKGKKTGFGGKSKAGE